MMQSNRIALALLTVALLNGQTVKTSIVDGSTPPAVQPGAPAGAIAPSGLERINLNNGHLSLVIPLLSVGGRGETGYSIVSRVSSQPWTVEVSSTGVCNTDPPACTSYNHNGSYSNVELRPFQAPYSPGVIYVKRSARFVVSCAAGGNSIYSQTYTHLVFEEPDGTQHELSDGTGIQSNGCGSGTPVTRGPRFRATDESGITFIATTTPQDTPDTLDPLEVSISGTLLFPNGLRYAVVNSVVTKITDRNGNFTTLSYTAGTRLVQTITDSQGRNTTVQHDISDGAGGFIDRIAYTGAAGTTHEIKIKKVRFDPISMYLRSDLTHVSNLFPQLSAGMAQFDQLPVEIKLQNNQSYQFRYNSYGEIARMSLPSGGAVEYDHGPGLANAGSIPQTFASGQILSEPGNITGSNPVSPWRPAIYRRLLVRRTYPSGGTSTAFESRTTYSRRESAASSTGPGAITFALTAYLETEESGLGITTPILTRHYFHENYVGGTPVFSYKYPAVSMLPPAGSYSTFLPERNALEGRAFMTTVPNLQMTEMAYSQGTDLALRLCQERTTKMQPGFSSLVIGRQFVYDSLGNQTEALEFNFGAAPGFGGILAATDPANKSGVDIPTACAAPSTSYARKRATTFETSSTYTGDARHLQRLPKIVQVLGPGGIEASRTDLSYDSSTIEAANVSLPTGHDTANYGSSQTIRGNVTSIVAQTGSGTISNGMTFDFVGNVRSTTDANSRTTLFSYADNCTSGPAAGSQVAYLTLTTLPAVSGLPSFTTSASHDCWIGKPRTFTDVNGVVTSFSYESAPTQFDRLLQVDRATGITSAASKSSYTYSDTPGSLSLTTKSSLRTYGDEALQSEARFDGFGRTTLERSNNIFISKVYDGRGRNWKTSNPSTTGSYIYTENTFDSLDRVTQVTRPGGATILTAYQPDGAKTTDESSIARLSKFDALGRLIAVTEDPNGTPLTTSYVYNPLDNLLLVCPHGGTVNGIDCTGTNHKRTFTYDKLSRLLSVNNPESGIINYTYDEVASTNGKGNLTSKSQQRGFSPTLATVSTRFHYDAWNRPTSKTYSGTPHGITTPDVTLSYDVHNPAITGLTTYPKGRLTRVEVTGGTINATDSYDPLGRPTRSRQITGTTTYRFGTDTTPGYEYLLNGSLSVQRYPSGRELQTGYDDLARPISVSGLMNGTTSQYLKSATYTAHGAPDVMRLNGDSLRERYGYDANRLQLTSVDVESCNGITCSTPSELLHLDFNYGTANNNGNLRDQTIRGSGLNLKQTYSYDSISRLSGFTEGPVGGANAIQETYCFDRHGNRAVLTRPGLSSMTPQVTACNEQEVLNLFPKNQIAGSVYDAGGQLKSDGRSELRFDIEERLRRTEPISGAATVYEYDGDGRRVLKQTGTATPAIFVYDAMGQLAAEYGSLAEATGVTYLHTDHLGSTRLVTDGTTSVKRMDFFPFGGELTSGDTAYRTTGALFTSGLTPTQKFTGKERDAETGLDYFGARYMTSTQGRFLITDGPFVDQKAIDPQSWNLYSYVRNRSLTLIDPDGREAISRDECSQTAGCIIVKVGIVLDKNADLYDDKGALRPEFQKSLDDQIARARDEYGSAGISLDVSVSKGTVSIKGIKGDGPAGDYGIIAGITDANGIASTSTPAAGFVTKSGIGVAFVNLRNEGTHSGTLAHEFAHLFGIEGRSSGFAGFLIGSTYMVGNAFFDIYNDSQRDRLRGKPKMSMSNQGRSENYFRQGARSLGRPR